MFVKGARTRALVGSIVFFWIAPAVVAGVGPFALVGWTMQPPLLGLPGVRLVGVAAVVAGLACLLDCFSPASPLRGVAHRHRWRRPKCWWRPASIGSCETRCTSPC